MKNLVILFISLFALSFNAFADIDVRGLSKEQIVQLQAIASQKAAENVSSAGNGFDKETLSFAAQWGQQLGTAAEGFAKAIGIAAKELGIAANEFLGTDAGKLTAILIIWKVAGASILSTLYGFLALAIMITFIGKLFKRILIQEYQSVETTLLFGLVKYQKRVPVYRSLRCMSDGEVISLMLLVVALAASLAIVGANII